MFTNSWAVRLMYYMWVLACAFMLVGIDGLYFVDPPMNYYEFHSKIPFSISIARALTFMLLFGILMVQEGVVKCINEMHKVWRWDCNKSKWPWLNWIFRFGKALVLLCISVSLIGGIPAVSFAIYSFWVVLG